MSRNAEQLRAYREAAIARGLCLECRKGTPRAGVKTCDDCLGRRAKRAASRKARGLCECGRKPTLGMKTCASCRASAAAREMVGRAVRRSQGLCHTCSAPAIPGRAACEQHLRRVREYARRRYRERSKRGQRNDRALHAIGLWVGGLSRDDAARSVGVSGHTVWQAARRHIRKLRDATARIADEMMRPVCP